MRTDDLLLIAEELAPGEIKTRQMCPRCGGGTSTEASLSIGRNEDGTAIWWKCWRASCGYAGGASSVTSRASGRAIKPRRFLDVRPVPEQCLNILEDKVKSSVLRSRTMYNKGSAEERFLFPVLTRDGHPAGWVMRSYAAGVRSKALTNTHGYKGCAWWTDTPSPKILVVVEDIPSAAWMFESTTLASCALMGATLTEDKLHDILAARPFYIAVCLDPDATSAAVRVCSALNAVRKAGRAFVVPLNKDIKDMSKEEATAIASVITKTAEDFSRAKT